MLVDSDPDRAASLEAALQRTGYTQVVRVGVQECLMTAVRQHQPDMVIIEMDSPDRDILEGLGRVSREHPKPIVFFAGQSDPATTRAAIRAGVSAYVVGDLPSQRLHTVLEVAIARFQEHQQLKLELADYKLRLHERKDVEKAKGILMQHRQISEDEAYKALRKLAMDRNMRIGEAARHFIVALELLG